MNTALVPGFVAGLVFASLLTTARGGSPSPQDPQRPAAVADMAAMMAQAKKYTQPSAQHEVLKRFLGEWNTETRLTMGGRAQPPERGTAEFNWLMEGRWLQSHSRGKFMGQDMRGFSLMGYDNFKQSFVTTSVSSWDTAMLRFEGDMDPSGDVLISYGTLDEYLTGEHDKMVKSVWRFRSDDEIVLEVHDLPIGEKHTQVFEIKYTRKA